MTQINNPVINQRSSFFKSDDEDIALLKLDLLQNYLNGSLILGTILFFVYLYISFQQGSIISILLTFLLFAILFVITFVRRINSKLRTILLCVVYFGVGIFSLLTNGLNTNGILYLFIAVLFLGLLGPRLWWILGLVATGLTTMTIGVLTQTDVIRTGQPVFESTTLFYWVSTFVIFLFLVYLVLSSTWPYLLKTSALLKESRDVEESLRHDNAEILDRSRSLENELDRRRSHLISGRQIARSIAIKNNSKELMQDAVDLIQSQFGYHFVGVYLTDDFNDYAVLQAATGQIGQTMLSSNHRLRIRDEGFIGYVITRGEPRLALNVDEDVIYSQDSYLLETRSELALPLKIGDHIFGAIDIHSEKNNAISQEDSDILQSIADQVAILIEKTRQLEKLQSSFADLQNAYSVYSRDSWRSHLEGSNKNVSFSFVENNLSKKEIIDSKELDVIQSGKKLVVNTEKDESEVQVSSLLIPIMLRDQSLGVLSIKYKGKYVPKELEDMAETVTARLSVAIENARLLEDIQDRADRERVVDTIATKVRAARDIDSILQTTASELGRFLGVDEVRVHLKSQGIEESL